MINYLLHSEQWEMATKNTFFWHSRKYYFFFFTNKYFREKERRCEKDKVIEGENMGGGTISGLQSEGNENNSGILFAQNKKGKRYSLSFFVPNNK